MTDQPATLEEDSLRALGAAETIGMADRLVTVGDPQRAVALYRAWIGLHPDDPLLFAMNFNLSVLLANLDDPLGASTALAETIRLNSSFFPPYINLGMVLERLGRPADALAQWYEVVNRLSNVTAQAIGHKTTALKQLARVLVTCRFDGNAEQALQLSLDVAPDQRDVLQHWLNMRQRQCEWPVIQPLARLSRSQTVSGLSPLSLAAYTDDPLLQLGVAADYARNDVGRPTASYANRHRALLQRAQPHRLRIGYLSSDLRAHAIGYLIAELFELHDRSAVEVFAYYCGPPAEDGLHSRIKGAADAWVDISAMSDEQAAEHIMADEIEILVDINGYTNGARTRILAMRPAPVIVNWLGFPGTTGSPYHSYIIADNFIIPPESEIFYSETVKRLPCYQPNDRRRVTADYPGSRQDAGLPENVAVFCCFNASQKLTLFTWRRWMRILREVDGSVLWLLNNSPSANGRLREHADAHGISPDRLVFAPQMANPLHLARYRQADLFLDTTPYGAHTTGSDALWAGLPVLTLPGRSFASRVCGSLVTAAGLPELVCQSSEDYVAKAIEFGRDRNKLAPYRARLQEGRDRCMLFDMPLLVSRLERVFQEMWDETVQGQVKRPNLVNLDLYREIGAALDRDDIEMITVADYRERYRAALADRHSFDVVQTDPRLWQEPA